MIIWKTLSGVLSTGVLIIQMHNLVVYVFLIFCIYLVLQVKYFYKSIHRQWTTALASTGKQWSNRFSLDAWYLLFIAWLCMFEFPNHHMLIPLHENITRKSVRNNNLSNFHFLWQFDLGLCSQYFTHHMMSVSNLVDRILFLMLCTCTTVRL